MEQAVWLDAAEQHVWRGFLRMNTRIYDELERDLRERSGMSLIEYGILAHLSEAPERRMRMRALADSVIVSKSRLSHQVARLERGGHVRREHCDDDRRGLWAVLTDDGADLLSRAAPGHAVRVRSLMFDRLSGEQIDQLAAIITALEPEPEPEPEPDRAGAGPEQGTNRPEHRPPSPDHR